LDGIEARWLFEPRPGQVGVLIHPESGVPSFVEVVDARVIAPLAPPDMGRPIQYALTHPARGPGPSSERAWTRSLAPPFERPHREPCPALELGYEVMGRGGPAGAALNAANETAVARFLAGEIGFLDIARACRAALDSHTYDPRPALETLWGVDATARRE